MDSSLILRETHLSDYWEILKNRFWVAFTFFLVCSCTVTLGVFIATPLYKGSTTILIEGENTNMLDANDSSTGSANFNIYENYIATQIAIIKSGKISGRVFEEFKLAETPRYKEKFILGKKLQKKFISDVEVERVRDTRMLEISVFNPDAKLASDLTNRLAEIYVQDNMMRRALTFIRNQRMASLNADYLRLQARFEELSNTLGPKHPEMIALKEEIQAMANRMSAGSGSDSNAPVSTEEQAILEGTLLKVQESSVFSSSRMSNIAIVDKAQMPKSIAKPRRLLLIAMGLFFGFFGGIMLAFFVDYLDNSIKSEEDLKKYLGKRIYLGYLLSEKKSDKSRNLDQLVLREKNSASTEAYKLLRTRILWSISNDNPVKDIMILSCIPQEGKTTVASNLAIALTQLDFKVLLVDTDFRKGRIAKSYDLPKDNGLANYLTGNVPFDSIVNKTSISGLSVVTCGKSDIDSWQLFNSSRMKQFISEAREKYDRIVYDTPPLTIISDTALLLSLVGGAAILTVRRGVTNTQLLSKGLSIIEEARANLLGVVLNGAHSKESRAYDYYHRVYNQP